MVATLAYNWPRDDGPLREGAFSGLDQRYRPFLLGRTALNYLVSRERIASVLLPAFICPLVVEVFLRRGCRVAFYDHIGPDLTIDESAVHEAAAAAGTRSHLLWVDYFGLGRDAPKLDGITTIVDAAHGLPLQTFSAPYVLFGARKPLHLPFGAFLFAAEGHGAEDRSAPPWLFATALSLRARAQRHELVIRHPRLRSVLGGAWLDLDRSDWFIDDSHGYPELTKQVSLRDLPTIAARRRSNYRRLAAAIGGPAAGETSCPLGLPFVHEARDELRRFLLARGVYTTATWSALHRLAAHSPRATALSQRILLLPTPHDLDAAQIDHVAASVRAFTA